MGSQRVCKFASVSHFLHQCTPTTSRTQRATLCPTSICTRACKLLRELLVYSLAQLRQPCVLLLACYYRWWLPLLGAHPPHLEPSMSCMSTANCGLASQRMKRLGRQSTSMAKCPVVLSPVPIAACCDVRAHYGRCVWVSRACASRTSACRSCSLTTAASRNSRLVVRRRRLPTEVARCG